MPSVMKWTRNQTMPLNQGIICQLENDAANAAMMAIRKYKNDNIKYAIIKSFLLLLRNGCLLGLFAFVAPPSCDIGYQVKIRATNRQEQHQDGLKLLDLRGKMCGTFASKF